MLSDFLMNLTLKAFRQKSQIIIPKAFLVQFPEDIIENIGVNSKTISGENLEKNVIQISEEIYEENSERQTRILRINLSKNI